MTTTDNNRLTHQQAHAFFDKLVTMTTDQEARTIIQVLRYDWQRQESQLIQLGGIHGDLMARYEQVVQQLDEFRGDAPEPEPSTDRLTVEMYERMVHQMKVMQAQIEEVQEAIMTEVYHHE